MRIAFTTLGCRLNQFETEGMKRQVREARPDATMVDWDADADVYVINSCTVTSRAEQKCRQLARSAKRYRPGAKVMVVGCYSQLNGERLREQPEIDAVLGNEEKRRLDHYLDPVVAGDVVYDVGRYRRGATMAEEWIDEFGGLSRATIKVQEGCDMRCTFCAIWKARGPSRSRPPRDVVEQAQRLASAGFEEIVLAGVHLGHYGRDLETESSLDALLDMLLEAVDERVRFRLSSIDPSEVDIRLAQRLLVEPRLCRYLHLPLQSGSDTVLRKMRRAYSARFYEQLVEQIGTLDRDFGLGVDVIVGFPGEDDAAFEETFDLLERLPIRFYHIFPYSDRPGTSAAAMADKVPGPVIRDRARRLRELGAAKRAELSGQLVGQTVEGVVESTEEDGRLEVMLDNYASVWCDADPAWEKRRVRVRVTDLQQGRLRGEVLTQPDEMATAS